MRLITHHVLACHAKGCTSNNFPLKFSEVEVKTSEAEFSPEFIKGFYPKIEWNVLVDTAKEVRYHVPLCAVVLNYFSSAVYVAR